MEIIISKHIIEKLKELAKKGAKEKKEFGGIIIGYKSDNKIFLTEIMEVKNVAPEKEQSFVYKLDPVSSDIIKQLVKEATSKGYVVSLFHTHAEESIPSAPDLDTQYIFSKHISPVPHFMVTPSTLYCYSWQYFTLIIDNKRYEPAVDYLPTFTTELFEGEPIPFYIAKIPLSNV